MSRPAPCAPSWIQSQQSFLGRDSILFFSIFILSRQIFLWLFNNLSCKVCCSIRFMLRQFYVWLLEYMLRHRQLCCNIDNCVATMFLCSFFKFVSRPSFYVATASLFGSCCNNVSCIVSIYVTTRKVCRDRVLSPLNLISCCSFILNLRHSFLVLSMFSIVTQFLCHDRTFLYSASICVVTQSLCRDRTFFFVLESFSRHRKSLSRPCLSMFSLSPCRDLKIPVAT